ncbi:response regulator [Balneolaceae bacterium YR4-1]|uniref:histidine kinase n=1 Tax=Halalkalibaculum roseum TaxID=2709311 RepID=A0A6M1T4W7_9BACT|nr:hybrid sensor histidine kinase/response regulator transcription factor [Halalkalibaculum roseum]NGP77837.1 response regulator [Halalkalibaculum roseum]
MQFLKGFILSVFCLIASDAFSQEVNFRHITIDDGLSQNAVYAILQDSRGFMWFGTKDGLNRYDGRNFVVYQHNPFDSTSISNAYVTRLVEDRNANIWTGSLTGDINILNTETGIFCKVPLENETGESLVTNEITDIAEGVDGNMWIATKGDGLIEILVDKSDGCNYGYRQYLHDPANDRSLNSNRVGNLFFDEDQTFWIGTEEGLNQFQESSTAFTRTQFDTKHPEAPAGSGEHKITAMHVSRAGTFWIGVQSGLVKFDRYSGNYEFYPNKYEVFEYGWGSINRIAEDQNGQLWLGTVAGLMRFDPSTKQYTYYQHKPFDPQSLSFNIISSLLIDDTGILWAGTSGLGINIHDFKANRFSTLKRTPDPSSRIAGFSIRSILEDNSGDVWISADVLYRWNRQTGDLKSYEAGSGMIDKFGNTGAYSMIQASDGMLWFASSQGLFRLNPNTNQTKLYKYLPGDDSGLRDQEVNAVFEDRDGTIWIATYNYFSKMIDEQAGSFQHFRYRSSEYSIGIARPVIFQDINGIFWLGTAEGLIRFDTKSETFTTFLNNPDQPNSLSNNHIKSILEDPAQPEQYLWIGTSGGLNKFDYRAGTFEHITEQDGLPNEVVYGILPDGAGNLWLSTNKGLSRFNPERMTFRNFDVKDGLQSNEFNTGAYFRSDSGELFFGGIQGLNYFYPDDIYDNPHQPPVVLTGIKLGAHPISYKTDRGLLDAAVSEVDHITFSHRDDVISFEFAALDFSSPEKNEYAYKLEGFNEEWIQSGNLASATYTNLPHGEYTFRVKGSNNDGIWNEEGLALAVIVTPPWWHTWWAYGLYLIVFVSVLYSLRRYELNRFNLKNELEIEKIQTGTLRNLDQLKSQFFANISHEFRTPLTLILGQTETLLQAEEDRKKKEKLLSVNTNAERLLGLINQLLELSKLEAGKMELQTSQHNIVSFLKNIFFSFESLADANQIQLNFYSSRPVINMDFDDQKMEQVFLNLFSNAFKFTESGGRIDLSIDLPVSGLIEIRMKDTGMGIPEEQLPHIFDRFYQADQTVTRKHEGTGIGLALARELIELHQGSISAFSEIGVGTEFVIQFPLVDSDVQNQEEKELSVQASSTAKEEYPALPDFGSILSENEEIVLIVEDNAEVRSFIREQLEDDYKIMEAANGREGVEVSQASIPDLIITDLMMPEMDGYRFSEKIRNNEKTSHIPVIMLTARAGLDAKIEGLEVGIDAFLTKPYHTRELKTRVKTLIEQRKNLRKQYSKATYFKPSAIAESKVDQAFLKKAIDVINEHLQDEEYRVEHLAYSLNMSVSQLNRKLNALVEQPAGTFIRSIRLQRSTELLNQTDKTIAEVCFEVGFNDQAYFSRAFKKQYGKSPSAFRKLSI